MKDALYVPIYICHDFAILLTTSHTHPATPMMKTSNAYTHVHTRTHTYTLLQVMLVRKKNATDQGAVYAMKVLKKDVIAAKGQIEHTKAERDILFEVRHPYIVRLRYAFQSEDKLYLVTDYYNGGTLFYHLRKSRHFSEERARFYAAELLSALEHLHSLNIIYRDLKLENVLMDHLGHLALTDFGLSKQNIDSTGGATTFCGTAEYIAPELLKGQKYGPAVDWWSFGILL